MLMPDSDVSLSGSSGNRGKVMMIQAAAPRAMRRASAIRRKARIKPRFGIVFTGLGSRVSGQKLERMEAGGWSGPVSSLKSQFPIDTFVVSGGGRFMIFDMAFRSISKAMGVGFWSRWSSPRKRPRSRWRKIWVI